MTLGELTLDRVISGEVDIEDLRITPDSLLRQAEIATKAGRDCLGKNSHAALKWQTYPKKLSWKSMSFCALGERQIPAY